MDGCRIAVLILPDSDGGACCRRFVAQVKAMTAAVACQNLVEWIVNSVNIEILFAGLSLLSRQRGPVAVAMSRKSQSESILQPILPIALICQCPTLGIAVFQILYRHFTACRRDGACSLMTRDDDVLASITQQFFRLDGCTAGRDDECDNGLCRHCYTECVAIETDTVFSAEQILTGRCAICFDIAEHRQFGKEREVDVVHGLGSFVQQHHH